MGAKLDWNRAGKIHGGNGDRTIDLYFKEIHENPDCSLINAEEEVRLATVIQHPLSDPEDVENAVAKLTRANLRFVASVAKHYQNQGLSLADLIEEGNIGLIKAAKRFDGTRGFKFISYAVWWIRQSILLALAENSRIVRLPLNRVGTLHKIVVITNSLQQELERDPNIKEIAKELELTLEEVEDTLKIAQPHLSMDAPLKDDSEDTLHDVLGSNGPAPDDDLFKEGLKIEIEIALDTLTPREAEVIELYFGLNGELSLTLEEIGNRFNLTRERVRQIKEKAIRRLGHACRSKKLKEYFESLESVS